MDNLYVIKIGGNIVDNEETLKNFLLAFSHIREKKILVHGGGKIATTVATALGIEQEMHEGRRITGKDTLKVVTMVYAGLVNKTIVAQLQSLGNNAIGFSGADGNAIAAHKRTGSDIDYGFVGDVDRVNTALFENLLTNNLVPVVAPITHDGKGQLLNTNADTIANNISTSLVKSFNVTLVYCFEKKGVLLDVTDEASLVGLINPEKYLQLKGEGRIYAGMIPKLDNAFDAIRQGVNKVVIGKGEDLRQLIEGFTGTTITS